jgi:hypothetical protein
MQKFQLKGQQVLMDRKGHVLFRKRKDGFYCKRGYCLNQQVESRARTRRERGLMLPR